jgi:hypothetical protein
VVASVRKKAFWLAAALVVAVVLVGVGRASVDTGSARSSGYRSGHTDGQYAGYLDGLQDGEAQGLQEGRTLQEASALPASARRPVKKAFTAGYVAGADDVFAGYDGGWALGVPYVITVKAGADGLDYRIGTRDPMKPQVNYFLCADGVDVCQQPD